MKILMVAPWVPSPVRPRSYGFIKMLSQKHDVWLVCQVGKNEEVEHLLQLPLAGLSLHPRQTVRGIFRAARELIKGGSIQVGLLDSPSIRQSVARLEMEWRPDAVHFNVARSAGAIGAVRRTPVLFDLDEIRSDYYFQLATGSDSFWRRALGRIEAPRLARAEKEIFAQSSAVVFSSPEDVSKASGAVLVRSPHELSQGTQAVPIPGRILFVGRLGYSANREAIRWFADHVFPGVRKQRPEATLQIVGENPGDLANLKQEGIDVIGWVDSLEPVYAAADIAIVPINLGTGVQMKLIQALDRGVPAVVTRVCLERSGAPSGVAVAADSVDEWISAIVELIGDRDARDALGRRGAKWAAATYSSDAIAASLMTAYKTALSRG